MRGFWGWLSIAAGIAAIGAALGALGLWAMGDPPPLGTTLQLVAGLVMVWFLSRALPPRG